MMTINQVSKKATLGWVYMMEVGTLECQKKKRRFNGYYRKMLPCNGRPTTTSNKLSISM